MMPQFNPAAMLTTLAVVLFPVLAADARAQLLLEVDGVELHGRARRTCPLSATRCAGRCVRHRRCREQW